MTNDHENSSWSASDLRGQYVSEYHKSPLGIRFMTWGYAHIGKPFIFHMDPDKAHDFTVNICEKFGNVGVFDTFLHDLISVDDPNLERTVMGVRYKNPFGLSAGLDKNAQLLKILDAAGFGFSSFGSMTYDPCEGNPRPWFHRLPDYQSLLIHAGLPNIGAEKVLAKADQIQTKYGLRRHASVGFTNKPYDHIDAMIDDFTRGVQLDMDSKTDVVEVNISCPNLTVGHPFQEAGPLDQLFTRLDDVMPSDRSHRKPIMVKMPSLEVKELDPLIAVLNDHNVQGLATCNLLEDRTGYDVPSSWDGSMSGSPCSERAMAAVKHIRDTYDKRFAIEGIGGVFTPDDALSMLDAGADLVGFVSTLMFNGPQQAAAFSAALSHAQSVQN